MLTSKFRVFEGPISCNEDCAVAIVKAACILHNFICICEGKFQHSSNFKTGGAVPATPDGSRLEVTTTKSEAVCLWNRLGNYFLKPEGVILIRWKYVSLL
jgi:hypothetical protein